MSRDYTFPEDKFLLIGQVGKPHGLRGELKVTCFSGQPENLRHYSELVLVDAEGRLSAPLAVKSCRIQGKYVVLAFASIRCRDEAEKTVGVGVLVAKENLPAVSDGEYYWHEYIGKRLLDQAGTVIGTIHQLFNNGAHDVFVVRSGKEELLIPVTKEVVVGEKFGDLIINPPPGMLEMNCNSST